jgi:protein TonB
MIRSRIRLAFAGGVLVAGMTGMLGAQTTVPAVSVAKPAQADDFLKGAYTADTPGLVAPKVKKFVVPKYTPDAMRAKLQGRVKVQVVVAADGTVDRARVIESLDKATGLDDQAVAAVKQWTFEAGRLNDKPVSVAVEAYLDFRLH